MTSISRDSSALVVLGAGPGGYAAAFRGADLGLSVTLVDPEPAPGGVCLHRGCIPSKALLHLSRLLCEAKEAAAWGVTFAPPELDLERICAWKDQVVGQMTGGLSSLCKARGVTLIRGRGVFCDSKLLRIDTEQGSPSELEFENAIIATGSRPATIGGLPLGNDRVMNSTGALALESIPASLLVIGGGYIGLELGSVYSALGAEVTVVEATDTLLPGVDAELVRVAARTLERRFAALQLSTRVESVVEDGEGLRVRLSASDGSSEQSFERVLVAVGRVANSSGLGLEAAGVRVGEQGFIEVDEAGHTSAAGIFAIGDVAGGPMLAHKATHEGLAVAATIAGGHGVFDTEVIPAVVYTDPELAWCGLTQAQAKSEGREVSVTRFPWQASGRAATLGRSDGLTKLVLDAADQRVLGVAIVGPGAGELIAEGALAVEMGALAEDIAATVHPHPTLSETLMEAAELAGRGSVHLPRRRRR